MQRKVSGSVVTDCEGTTNDATGRSTDINRKANRDLKVRRGLRRRIACTAMSAVLTLGCVGIWGCSGDASGSSTQVGSGKAGEQNGAKNAEGNAEETSALIADIANMDRDYSKRDKDPSYDIANSTRIRLNGSSADIDDVSRQASNSESGQASDKGAAKGVTVDGSMVTIGTEGTFILSGKLDNGQIAIDAADTDKVHLVLDGVDIHNEDGPTIYIKQADKCFITLADGSMNTLTDGSGYTLEDDTDEPYATLFSKDDLTINGSGALDIEASYRHAVASKDDLVITGGTIDVKASEDALRGRDCVKVSDGTFNIESGEDAIKSNNDEDPTRGFVSIDGGIFAIKAGDDAIHGEFAVFVEGGQINVDSCYEGLEAQQVYVNEGIVNITSSDDSINASSPGDSASSGGSGDMGRMDGPRDLDTADGIDNTDGSNNAGGLDNAGDFEERRGGMQPPTDGENRSDMELSDKATRPEIPPMDGDSDIDPNVPTDGGPDITGDGSESPNMAQRQRPDQDSDTESGMRSGKGFGRPQDGNSGESSNTDSDMAPDMGNGKGGFLDEFEEGCLIEINGGDINLATEGDGVDSNGDFTMNGGTLFVSGPTNSGNGSLDVAGSAAINGGTVMMAGASGMAQTFTGGTQAYLSARISGNANEAIAIENPSGASIISFMPNTQYSFIVASSPSMVAGETYTVKAGQASVEAKASV